MRWSLYLNTFHEEASESRIFSGADKMSLCWLPQIPKVSSDDLEIFVRLHILEASLIKTFCLYIINLCVCVFALIQNLLE